MLNLHQLNYPEIESQIRTTIATLNNLKDLKQGAIGIKYQSFELTELLKNLKHNIKLENAIINFTIKNDTINSDKQKITECINELIENSLRHNAQMELLNIDIALQLRHDPTILGHKREGYFLHIIYRDNGKGIDEENKEWIFNPLNSTLKNGSGLGLFIVKRIIEKLHGVIYENGANGVQFHLFIPNNTPKEQK